MSGFEHRDPTSTLFNDKSKKKREHNEIWTQGDLTNMIETGRLKFVVKPAMMQFLVD